MAWIHKVQENIWVQRVMLFLFGTTLLFLGLATLKEGRIDYKNYWGGIVFAPFAIAIGAFILVVLIFKWNKLNERSKPLKGKARRRAEEAAETKFPIDDYENW